MKIREFFTGLFLFGIIFGGVVWAHKDAEAMIVSGTQTELVQHTVAMERKYDLPPQLLVAICQKESNWQNVRGAHGEIGVCQIKPASAEHALGKAKHSRPTLTRGSRGALVRVVQGMVGASVDGVYGPDTTLLVAVYQADHNLRVDGIVGPQTWESLLGPPDYKTMLWDPKKNIELAAKYLVWLREVLETDDPAILMAAYNGGPGHPMVKYMVSVEQYRQTLMPPLEAYLMEDLR